MFRHSGARSPRSGRREPGIHEHRLGLWIPGSLRFADAPLEPRNDRRDIIPRNPPRADKYMSESDADVRLVGVEKRYGTVLALPSLDLAVERGSFFALLGPS